MRKKRDLTFNAAVNPDGSAQIGASAGVGNGDASAQIGAGVSVSKEKLEASAGAEAQVGGVGVSWSASAEISNTKTKFKAKVDPGRLRIEGVAEEGIGLEAEYIFISPQPRGRYGISPARARAIYYMSPRALARGGHIFV